MAELIETSKIEAALVHGDLSKLSEQERLGYYKNVCESLGLNPLTQPFQYMTLQGKQTLYATRACAEQLRKINKISIQLTHKERMGDVYVVTARARDKDNREDESSGAVSLGKAQGEALANLFMKAETKAKRRVTLSISGLGFLDETEVETIPGIQKNDVIGIAKPISERALKAIKAFEPWKISQFHLEKFCKKSSNQWDEKDYEQMKALWEDFEAKKENPADFISDMEIIDF